MAQLYLRLGGIVPIARGITCQQVFLSGDVRCRTEAGHFQFTGLVTLIGASPVRGCGTGGHKAQLAAVVRPILQGVGRPVVLRARLVREQQAPEPILLLIVGRGERRHAEAGGFQPGEVSGEGTGVHIHRHTETDAFPGSHLHRVVVGARGKKQGRCRQYMNRFICHSYSFFRLSFLCDRKGTFNPVRPGVHFLPWLSVRTATGRKCGLVIDF